MTREEFVCFTELMARMVEYKISEALMRADTLDRWKILRAHEEEYIRLHIAPQEAEDAELNAIADARKDMPEVSVKLEDL